MRKISSASLMNGTVLGSALLLALTFTVQTAQAQDAAPVSGETQLETIVVKTGKGKRQPETTVAVTQEEIEREKPETPKELFRKETAVQVSAPTAFATKVYVNGLEETSLNVQVDGARRSNRIWHHNANNLLDPTLLKAARVDAGVAPADAGPAALGGAISYVTKDVADLLEKGDNFGAFTDLGYDSNSRSFTRGGSAYGRIGGFEYLGYLSFLNGHEYKDGAGNRVQGTEPDLASGLGKLAYESEDGHRLELNGRYMRDEGIRPFRANLSAANGQNLYNYQDFRQKNISLTYTTTNPTEWYNPELTLYFTDTDLSRPNNGIKRPGFFDSGVRNFGGKAQNTFGTEWGDLTTGFEFYSDHSDVNDFVVTKHEKANNVGAFVQLRSDVTEALTVSTGLRVDQQWFTSVDNKDFSNFGASPNITASYAFNDNFSVDAGASSAFGGIDLAEIALFHNGAYTYAPDLDPTRSNNIKAGATFNYEGLTLRAELFRTAMDNAPAYNYAIPQRINGMDVETRGINLSAAYDWDNMRLGGKYSHTDVRYNDMPIGTLDFYIGAPVGDVFTLFASYTFEDYGLTVDYAAQLALDYHDFPQGPGIPIYEELDGYQVHNVALSWTPEQMQNLTLKAGVDNIFDEDYVDRTSGGTGRVNIKPLSEQGRNFKISLRTTF